MRTIVNIDVPVLPPAIEFYTKALGLQLQRIIDGDVAELIGASSTIYLLAKAAGTAAHAVDTSDYAPNHTPNYTDGRTRNYGRHWTPVHIDFVVDDVEAAAEQAVVAGATRDGERVEWRGSKCITLSDPFGHGFCLIQFDEDSYSDDE